MPRDSHAPAAHDPLARPLAICWAVAVCALVGVEVWRTAGSGVPYLAALTWDTSVPLLVLLLAPAAFLVRRRIIPDRLRFSADDRGSLGIAWAIASGCGVLSLVMSCSVANRQVLPEPLPRFGDLPPAYHDEYSYLLQAETYLGGQLAHPPHPTHPELFSQVHVLHRSRMASRYFPAAGVWLAPWQAIGRPLWGWYVAGALSTIACVFIGRELSGNGCGLAAGLLMALSPGLALFANLLLAHHPTLLGLSIFLLTFLRYRRTRHVGLLIAGGSALTFAMLCRPMTAAGFALHCGLAFGFRLLFDKDDPPKRRLLCGVALGLPILVGFGLLMVHNHALTDDALTTGYSRYTNLHTPRHAYGFDNAVRGAAAERSGDVIQDDVLASYDRWAENLTWSLAVRNVGRRLTSSLIWTWGLVPLALAVLLWIPLRMCSAIDRRFDFIIAGVTSLHIVHLPYWFAGIMGWHYVFETAPLLLLLTAGVTASLCTYALRSERELLIPWWLLLLVCGPLSNFASTPLTDIPRFDLQISELAFSRIKHYEFDQLAAPERFPEPALLLIAPDPSDLHIDYVHNPPTLDSHVLRGRWRSDLDVEEVRRAFPDRKLYKVDVRTGEVTPL